MATRKNLLQSHHGEVIWIRGLQSPDLHPGPCNRLEKPAVLLVSDTIRERG